MVVRIFPFSIVTYHVNWFLVTVNIKARKVIVTGPRGTLEREFKHTAIEMTRTAKTTLTLGVWFGQRKHIACIQTIASHIRNMVKGVTLVIPIDLVYA